MASPAPPKPPPSPATSPADREAGSRPWLASYPPDVPHEIVIPEGGVADQLKRAAERWPDRPAMVFALAPGIDRTWTFRELWESTGRFAAALHERGYRKGDRLALYLPNCPEYVIAYFGALRLGLTVVQISPLYINRDLVFPLRDSGARGVVTLDILSHNLEKVWGEVEPEVFVGRMKEDVSFLIGLLFVNRGLRKQGYDPSLPTRFRWTPFRSLLRATSPPPSPPLDPAKDVAVFQYTGGTTGRPKAAMLTHRNLVANVAQCHRWLFPGEPPVGERVLAVIPFFHVYGMTVALNFTLFMGATVIVNPQRPEPGLVLRLIERYHPTQFPAVPALYNGINHYPGVKDHNLRGIGVCLSGSAPLPLEVARRFHELTGADVLEGYGLSETSPVTHANPVRGVRKEGSVGLPLPGTDCRIVDLDDATKVLPVGEVGELALRGPQVMLGYWNQPEETAQVLKDGWLLTGDIARMDPEGYTYIVDRKKDMILVGGFNVYPREVEEILYQHPDIAEAAVVGVPDPQHGEVVKAFVVPKTGRHPTEAEIIAFVRERIAHFKAPRSVEFRESLPKSLVGKVLRRELRAAPKQMQEPSAPGG